MTESADLVDYLSRCYEAAAYLASGDSFEGARYRRAMAEFSEYRPVARQVADRVAPDLASAITEDPSEAADVIGQLIGIVRHSQAVERLLPPIGPSLRADALHERVWDSAKHRWDDGRPLDAVRAAAAEVEQQIRAKSGIHDGDASALIGSLYSTKPPTAGQPRLRFVGVETGSNDWRSLHEGAAQFGRGVFMAIRNPYAHRNDEPPIQEALEHLAALSVLARWVDRSVLEQEPSATP